MLPGIYPQPSAQNDPAKISTGSCPCLCTNPSSTDFSLLLVGANPKIPTVAQWAISTLSQLIPYLMSSCTHCSSLFVSTSLATAQTFLEGSCMESLHLPVSLPAMLFPRNSSILCSKTISSKRPLLPSCQKLHECEDCPQCSPPSQKLARPVAQRTGEHLSTDERVKP